MLITTNNISEIAASIKSHVGDNTALISVGEHSEFEIPELVSALNEAQVNFLGGIFPKVIFNDVVYEKGIVVNTLYNVIHMSTITNISEKEYDISPIEFDQDKKYSLITYVDGLTSNISSYLGRLYENYGMKTNYFGGGTGSLSLIQSPCVFSKDGFFQDAAVFCVMESPSSIGVKHGWKKLEGPYIVTKATGKTIEEINWEKPYEIYKNIVEADSNETFTESNFLDIAKGYPIGVIRQGFDYVIRDPLTVGENGELVCIGDIEENTLIDVMKGDTSSLITSAKDAAEECLVKAENPGTAIIIDCITRGLHLGDEYIHELENVSKTIHDSHPNVNVGGALTLGEISSFGNGYIEFYNRTIVVGLFE